MLLELMIYYHSASVKFQAVRMAAQTQVYLHTYFGARFNFDVYGKLAFLK